MKTSTSGAKRTKPSKQLKTARQLELFQSSAVLDSKYRYFLERRWSRDRANLKVCLFIMLNPSTADAIENDPTIRRCVNFAKAWGCGALWVCNVYALRATDPEKLKTISKPIGALNFSYLCWSMGAAEKIVLAWGTKAEPKGLKQVWDAAKGQAASSPFAKQLYCLGLTKDGHPRHPLYVRADTPLKPVRLRDDWKLELKG